MTIYASLQYMAEKRLFFLKDCSQISWRMTEYGKSLITLSIRKVYNSVQEAGMDFNIEFGNIEKNHLKAEKQDICPSTVSEVSVHMKWQDESEENNTKDLED